MYHYGEEGQDRDRGKEKNAISHQENVKIRKTQSDIRKSIHRTKINYL